MDSNPIRIVVYRDGEAWVAQCLEFDIGTQAESPNELRDRLDDVIAMEAAISAKYHGKPFAGIDPAPQRFFDMWDSCESDVQEWNSSDCVKHAKVEMAMCA